MKVLLLCGSGEHQRALAHRLHNVLPLSAIGIVVPPRSTSSDWSQRVSGITVGLPLRLAWQRVLAHYAEVHERLPHVNTSIHDSANAPSVGELVRSSAPDLVLVSGTDLLRTPIIHLIGQTGRVMNLHTGISPHLRGGPNCTNWALCLRRFDLIGSTVMWLDSGIDSGDVIASERTPLHGDESISTLHLKVMEHAHGLYCRSYAKYVAGDRLKGTPQELLGHGRLFLNRQWTARPMAKAVYNFYRHFPDSVGPGPVALVPLADAGTSAERGA